MSDLLSPYLDMLGESVTWRQRTGVNQYNEPAYSDSIIIVIWYDDERTIRTAEGEQFQQLAYIQTTALIQKGDAIIRDSYTWPIRGIQKTPHPEGEQFRIGNLGERQI